MSRPTTPSDRTAGAKDDHSALMAPTSLSRRDALKAGAASMATLLTISPIGPALLSELARLAGGKPMTGARLADILHTERARWNSLLAEVRPDRMETPGVEGKWSVKQIVAHLTWYERQIVLGAQRARDTGAFTRDQGALAGLTLDERNDRLAAESSSRPLSDVLAEADQVFAQLLTIIVAAPQDALNDPQRLGLPDDIPPWMRVANNSYAHYRSHAQAVRDWLTRQ